MFYRHKQFKNKQLQSRSVAYKSAFSRVLSLFLLTSAFICCLALSHRAHAAEIPKKVVAITQIVAHPALDKVRVGMIDELAASGYQDGKTITIEFANAQGNVATAAQIAGQFVGMHPDVIAAIATPSAQSVVNATKHTAIPVVFASITDPIQAKLVDNLQHPNGNVTGTRNVLPVDKQIALIKQILPQAKTIGIILNNGEENSVESLQLVTAAAKRADLSVKTVGVMSSADVASATASLVGHVDAIFLLQDNTVASALPALLTVAQKNQLPVFSSYTDAVTAGALAGVASDDYLIGKQTGKMIVRILQGKKPSDLAVEDPKDIKLVVNAHTAQLLHITLPPAVLKSAQEVITQ